LVVWQRASVGSTDARQVFPRLEADLHVCSHPLVNGYLGGLRLLPEFRVLINDFAFPADPYARP
jgi:hypothetical protein